MDDWKKFNETLLPFKIIFHSHFNIEDIINTDEAHTKRICKNS